MIIEATTKKKIKRYISLLKNRKRFHEKSKWIFNELRKVCLLEGVDEINVVGKNNDGFFGYNYSIKRGGGYSTLLPSEAFSTFPIWISVCEKYNVDMELATHLKKYNTNKKIDKIIIEECKLSDEIESDLGSIAFKVYGEDMTNKIVIFDYREYGCVIASFVFKYSFDRHNMGWKQINNRTEMNVQNHTIN
jgi:hypothetical protein